MAGAELIGRNNNALLLHKSVVQGTVKLNVRTFQRLGGPQNNTLMIRLAEEQ